MTFYRFRLLDLFWLLLVVALSSALFIERQKRPPASLVRLWEERQAIERELRHLEAMKQDDNDAQRKHVINTVRKHAYERQIEQLLRIR